MLLRIFLPVKTLRLFLAMTFLVIGAQFLLPVLGFRNELLFQVFKQNCGAVPLFFENLFSFGSPNDYRVLYGFITCGLSVVGFLVIPGTLTAFVKLAKFVLHG